MANDKQRRIARERVARAKRAANAATESTATTPVTEASQTLAAAFDDAGRPELAARARALEWDENYSPAAMPISDLAAVAMLNDLPGIVERAVGGDFDSTKADNDAYYATPHGRSETALYDKVIEQVPQETLDNFEQAARRLSADPQRAQRLTEQFIADLAERIGLRDPAADADVVVTAEQINPHLHELLGNTHANGTRLDTPEILAAAEIVGRGGGTSFTIDCDDAGERFKANATFDTARGPLRISSDELPEVNAAARNLVHKIIGGGQCRHCGAVITFDPRGYHAKDKTLINGTGWTVQEQKDAGPCLWYRHGPHWQPGCKPPS